MCLNYHLKFSKLQIEPILEASVTGDVELSKANTYHVKNMLGWNPKIPLEKGIAGIMNR